MIPAHPPTYVAPLRGARRQRALAGLGAAGRQLATDLLADFGGWTAGELAVLREAAEAADTLAAVRAAIRSDGVSTAPQRLLRTEHQASGRLTKAIAQLRLEGRTHA